MFGEYHGHDVFMVYTAGMLMGLGEPLKRPNGRKTAETANKHGFGKKRKVNISKTPMKIRALLSTPVWEFSVI